jgi:hypothetical protein
MLELWNNWYEGLAEALAIVNVFVVAGLALLRLRKVGGDKRFRQGLIWGETGAQWSRSSGLKRIIEDQVTTAEFDKRRCDAHGR